MAYTPKPPHFHRVRQFVDIFTGTREKRKDLYLGNSSKCVPIVRGSKRWVRGKGKEKEGSHAWRDAKTSEATTLAALLERRIIGSVAYSQ